MKKQLLLLAFILGACFAQAQQNFIKLEYTYDANGNRISRDKQLVLHKSSDNGNTNSNQGNTLKQQENKESVSANLSSYQVFPNPSTGIFTLKIDASSIPQNSNVEVYDKMGKLIFKRPLTSLNTQLDLSTVSDGVYELRILTSTQTLLYKLIKVN